MTETLRAIPDKKARGLFCLRWMIHLHEVYNELNPDFLKRPEVITAFNQLYDEVEKYQYCAIMNFPSKSTYYVYGIVPYCATFNKFKMISPRSFLASPFGNEGIVPFAGMPFIWLDPQEIALQLGLPSIRGTAYEKDHDQIQEIVMTCYLALYKLIREEIEAILFQKVDAAYSKSRINVLTKLIDKTHAERIRAEEKYKQTISTIDEKLDRIYKEMEELMKKSDTQ